jgi:phytoene dehydrogenase-like protein
MPEIYRQVFESLHIIPDENYKTTPLTTIYKLYFGDGTQLAFTTDKNHLKEQLESIEKGSYQQAEKLIKKGYALFQLAISSLLGRNFYHLFQFVTLKNALLLFKLKTHQKHANYVKRFFKNENLRKAFTFQNIYVGQNPYTAPALFAMLPATELTEGSLFPTGGMFSIITTLISAAEASGVRFVYNEPVIKILTGKNRATGVVLQNGSTINANVVVANADLPYVYKELLPDRSAAAKINIHRSGGTGAANCHQRCKRIQNSAVCQVN